MIIDLLNKFYIFLFVLSMLNIIRHTFFLYRSVNMKEKFEIGSKKLLFFGLSISYVITSIIELII